jgi:hypothetical protein
MNAQSSKQQQLKQRKKECFIKFPKNECTKLLTFGQIRQTASSNHC